MAETKDKEMKDGDLEILLKAIHPVPKTQDGNCPHISWMGYDLGQCPGIGDWKCMIQQVACGEFGECVDYNNCSNPSHGSCPVYLNKGKKS